MRKVAPILISMLIVFSASGYPENEKLSASDYIQQWKDEAVYQMVVHKIPASITLAQGLLESGNGNSRLALEGNNHFGIKCHNDWTGGRIFEDDETRNECFRKYQDATQSFEDHSVFLQRKRYEPLFRLDPDDYKGWAKTLKECGYATNPKYPQLLINLIETYDLARFDREGLEHIRRGSIPARPNDVTTRQETKPTTPAPKIRHGKNEKESRAEITIGNARKIELSDNKIKFVRAKAGDTPAAVAAELDLGVWQITRYNDVQKSYVFQEGEIIYIQPKRNKAAEAVYTVKSGDTLEKISQQFGVKQKKILSRNQLGAATDLKPGMTLRLR